MRCIAEGDGDVSQPSGVADSADGWAFGEFAEVLLSPGK